jgi:drug/metabolite transporter (DMT)-like permease
MGSLLALVSSVLWGAADYIGGNLSKRFKSIAVTGVSQSIGLLFGIAIVLISGSYIAPTLDWNGYFLPGIIAGIAGFLGLTSFYAGLATGRMGVVSPISSLGALLPFTIALIGGERPMRLQLLGMVIALIGGFCASGPELNNGLPIKPLFYALGATFGFGIALTFMAKGSETSPLLTMTMMRVTSVSVCILIALRYRQIGGFKLKDLPMLAFIGVADFVANFLLGLATTKGLVSIAMVLGSLFPIVTALLAFKFLHERLHKVQYLGILFAIIGVAMISLA